MFDQTEYKGVDFSEAEILEEQLSHLTFRDCRCDFSSASLNGITARRCAFLNCSFRFADCFAASFEDCKMTGSVFDTTNCTAMQLLSGDWSYTYLAEMDFNKRKLTQVNFTGADLSRCKFEKAVLRDCNFSEANLNGVSFQGADLRGSVFAQVDFLSLNLKNAKIDLNQAVAIAESIGAVYTP